MGKKYLGRKPDQGEGWQQIDSFLDGDEVEWLFYKKPQEHSNEWFTYKIVANGEAENKANYWLVRNNQTKQIGFGKDFSIMRNNRPDLHSYFENLLSDEH